LKSKILGGSPERTLILVFETGEEVVSTLLNFAKTNGLAASHFTAIGAFRDVTLGYFDWENKHYRRIFINEQVEVLSLIGDIALEDGEPKAHAHVVVGKSDGSAHGGHLLEGHVRPTLELILVESPAHLRKTYDPDSRLALIDLETS
jgi:uncharacterized protein